MANLSDKIAAAIVDHSIDLLRLADGMSAQTAALLRDLFVDIFGRTLAKDLTSYSAARLGALLRDVTKLIAEAYGNIDDLVGGSLAEFAKAEAEIISRITNTQVGIDLTSPTLPSGTLEKLAEDLLIQGAPSREWWARQSKDLTFRFANTVRVGMASSETTDQIVRRLKAQNLLTTAQDRARALVHTSVQTVANQSRLAVFQANADVIASVEQISTLDSHTTDICIAYDHQNWDLQGEPIAPSTLPFEGGPPRHFNCRSVLIPITKSWDELTGVKVGDVDQATRASMDGQVSSKLSFSNWLAGKSVAQQNAILGVGKAELWRNGKISLTDLVDQRGNALTLEELRNKHGI